MLKGIYQDLVQGVDQPDVKLVIDLIAQDLHQVLEDNIDFLRIIDILIGQDKGFPLTGNILKDIIA